MLTRYGMKHTVQMRPGWYVCSTPFCFLLVLVPNTQVNVQSIFSICIKLYFTFPDPYCDVDWWTLKVLEEEDFVNTNDRLAYLIGDHSSLVA